MKKMSWKSITIGCLSIAAMLTLNSGYSAVAEPTVVEVYDVEGLTTALAEGAEITCCEDIQLSSLLTVSQDSSIDLNGYKLYASEGIVIAEGQSLVIRDGQYGIDEADGEMYVLQGIDATDATLVIESGSVIAMGRTGSNGTAAVNQGEQGGEGSDGGCGIGGRGATVIVYDGKVAAVGGVGGQGGTGGFEYWNGTAQGGKGGIGGQGGAGIGGQGTTVVIHGGTLTATGGKGGMGGQGGSGAYGGEGGKGGKGGSGIDCVGGSITVNGGTVTATGTGGGVGGEGGMGGYGGEITAGAVGEAELYGGAGIANSDGTVKINSGVLSAVGAYGSAGIGGRYVGEIGEAAGTLQMTGGSLSATAGQNAFDIGSAYAENELGSGGSLKVTGGELRFNTDGSATNAVELSFAGCTVYGEGAGVYEGIYNADGKIGIAVKELSINKNSAHADEILMLTATLRIAKKSDLMAMMPQGKVVFKTGAIEIGFGSIDSTALGEDGYVTAVCEVEWTGFAGEHLITAEYIPSESDHYGAEPEGDSVTADCLITDHSGGVATCTELAVCTLCNEKYGEVDLLNHVGSTHIEGQVEATCCSEGYTGDTVCDSCTGISEWGSVIGMLEHELTEHEAQAPTCTEIGWEKYQTCINCDYTTYAELSATGHSYTEEIIPPTETSEGYTLHTCGLCGDSYQDNFVGRLGVTVGDLNEDDRVASDDAVYLLRHTLFPDLYPINQKSDFNGDSSVDSADAIYLLRYTLFPDLYPIEQAVPQAQSR